MDITGDTAVDARVHIPALAPPGSAQGDMRVFHVILDVTDDGSPPLTSYRRVVISVPKKAGKTCH